MVAKMLERPALVLNRNWQPVNVATVARSLVMLWNESARVVDPHDYQQYTWADWSQLVPRAGEMVGLARQTPTAQAKSPVGGRQQPPLHDFRRAHQKIAE